MFCGFRPKTAVAQPFDLLRRTNIYFTQFKRPLKTFLFGCWKRADAAHSDAYNFFNLLIYFLYYYRKKGNCLAPYHAEKYAPKHYYCRFTERCWQSLEMLFTYLCAVVTV